MLLHNPTALLALEQESSPAAGQHTCLYSLLPLTSGADSKVCPNFPAHVTTFWLGHYGAGGARFSPHHGI